MTFRQPPTAHALPWWVLAPLTGLAGLATTWGFAPHGFWPVPFLTVAVLGWAITRTSGLLPATLIGWLFGLGFMATSLLWQTAIFWYSYLGLVALTSSLYALIGLGVRAVRDLPGAPAWGAAWWMACEWLLSVFPFGGFMWMRLGYSQVDSPLAAFYPLTGAASVSLVVALDALGLARLFRVRGGRPLATGVLVAVALILFPLLGHAVTGLNAQPLSSRPPVQVGWVQGGAPGGGVYGLGPPRTITTNQRNETVRLAERAAAGQVPRPDLVVWPENATDMDPRRDRPTGEAVADAVDAVGVPILVGAIYQGPGPNERQTVSTWWTEEGPQQTYAKRNLVPFGEFVPFRDVLLPLIPVLQYVGAQSVPGTDPGVLHVSDGSGEPLAIGVAICYEVIYPETVYDTVRHGADILVVQSSNAMYQGTDQIEQQFAITRVRAAEIQRPILVVTTSGISGLINPDGSIEWTAPSSASASGVVTLEGRSHVAPVVAWGRPVEAAGAIAGLVGVVLGLLRARGRRSDARLDGSPEPGAAKE